LRVRFLCAHRDNAECDKKSEMPNGFGIHSAMLWTRDAARWCEMICPELWAANAAGIAIGYRHQSQSAFPPEPFMADAAAIAVGLSQPARNTGVIENVKSHRMGPFVPPKHSRHGFRYRGRGSPQRDLCG